MLDEFIGDLSLEAVHMGSLQFYINARQKDGVKNRTINAGLQITPHILNLAASEWLDEHGLTWIASAPKIKLLPEHDKRQPYPLSWEEQNRLFKELPFHLRQMALSAVNTGCRDAEICSLQWKWEIKTNIPHCSVFIIPKHIVKNREDRLVLLNRIARNIIEEMRGQHSEYVFTFRGRQNSKIIKFSMEKSA